jgi:DNA-directed RNA polymerase subunit RPC12/RpoP
MKGFKTFRLKYHKILMVSGSSGISDPIFVRDCLDDIRANMFEFDALIHGNAKGVDEAVQFYAESRNIPVFKFPALWDKYGKPAGVIRNIDMITSCEKGIVIWDGKSKGSKHAKDNLSKAHKLLKSYYYNGDDSRCQSCGSKVKFIKRLENGTVYRYRCWTCLQLFDVKA